MRDHWDRLCTYVCFAGFGVASLINPPASQETIPRLIGVVFNCQLVLAGVLMLIGLFTKSNIPRRTGYVIYLLGMLTVGLLIFVYSASPVAILVLGFAFQGVVSVRYISRDQRVAEELGKIVRQLEEKDHGD